MDEHFMTGDSGIHSSGLDEQNAPGLMLPRWFMITISAVAGCFSITFVPWSVWITWTVVNLTNDVNNRQNDALANRARIERVEDSTQNHALQLQAISSTRFTAEQANALNNGTLAEIRSLAKEVQALQRDFDRNFNKAKPAANPNEINSEFQ